MTAPAPLAENVPFAFRGEALDAPRLLTPRKARALLDERNPTGKPNADVLREFIGVSPDGAERRRWALDFPPEMSTAQGGLYLAPFAALSAAGLPLVNAGRNGELRNALARVERFLAAPADGSGGFAWIEGEVVPDDSLVIWARDDDFSAGILASEAFGVWAEFVGEPLAALRSFPFPWPPATPLSALTRVQEELRFAVSRAARSEDDAAINDAVCAAYGWSAETDEREIVDRLRALHEPRMAE